MSTHCRIALVCDGGSVKSIYCHNDGYIRNGVGVCLNVNYKDEEKIKKLMDLGDLSSLGNTLKHSPESWNLSSPIYADDDLCITYRDRGDDLDSMEFSSLAEYVDWLKNSFYGVDCSYLYIYYNGEWWLQSSTTYEPSTPLAQIIKNF